MQYGEKRKKIGSAGLENQVEFHKDFEGPGRNEFFKKVSLISVPVLEGEAFGLYLLEAMASQGLFSQASLASPESFAFAADSS